MKKMILIATICFFGHHTLFAQCDEMYTLDWDTAISALPSGWAPGATDYSMTTTGMNQSTVGVNFEFTGDTSILVNGSETPTTISTPVVTALFYQSLANLITAVEASEMQNGESVTLNITFSEPVYNLNFTLFDVDANTPLEAGADRQEVIQIGALDENSQSLSPQLTGSASNIISGDSAIGLTESPAGSTNGNVFVNFNNVYVSQVSITFSIQNIVGTPNANAEPGFGLYDLNFCTPLIPLPLHGIELNVVQDEKGVELQWKGLGEHTDGYFEAERSVDNRVWHTIGTVDAKPGNPVYTHYDRYNEEGIFYYRIKYVDVNGKILYSNTLNVKFQLPGIAFQAYPNPVEDKLFISGNEALNYIELYSLDGCRILNKILTSDEKEYTLSVSDIYPGTYLLRTNAGVRLICIYR